jgi:carbonic anhydrase
VYNHSHEWEDLAHVGRVCKNQSPIRISKITKETVPKICYQIKKHPQKAHMLNPNNSTRLGHDKPKPSPSKSRTIC